MTGRELLDEVFGNAPTTMLSLLTSKVSKYNRFGSAGVYNYLWIVYFKVSDGVWRYRDESNRSLTISRDKAEEKAIAVRDSLIFCVDAIEQYGTFQSIADYQELQNTLKKVFFFDYNWVLKYYQMLYPQFFPGMYGEDTLDRALHILGLPNHKGDKFIAAGEISLFIRRCKVHNIIFNEVYSAEWGWDDPKPPCENAAANFSNRLKPIAETNDADYSLKIGIKRQTLAP